MCLTQLLVFDLRHWYRNIVCLRTIHNGFDLWIIECPSMPCSWPVVSCDVQLSITVQTRKNPSILLPVVVGSDDDYRAWTARLVVPKQRLKRGNKRHVYDEYDRDDLNEFQCFSRSVRVLYWTGRSILTCRRQLFAAPASIQSRTSWRNVVLNIGLPLGIVAPLWAVPSSFCMR